MEKAVNGNGECLDFARQNERGDTKSPVVERMDTGIENPREAEFFHITPELIEFNKERMLKLRELSKNIKNYGINRFRPSDSDGRDNPISGNVYGGAEESEYGSWQIDYE